MLQEQLQEQKTKQFKELAEKQREKIKTLKQQEQDLERPSKLSEAAPQAVSEKSQKKAKKAKSEKPAWAVTEKQSELQKEDEIDQLLEFAYELDYEKYMEDFEVRQALAVIKDRVNEIKQQPDWKQKMADEWNQAD